MTGRLRGAVAEIGEEDALTDVLGVGYVVRCGARTLARLPAGDPIADSPEAPLVVGFQAALLLILIAGLALQLLFLRRPVRGTVLA